MAEPRAGFCGAEGSMISQCEITSVFIDGGQWVSIKSVCNLRVNQ